MDQIFFGNNPISAYATGPGFFQWISRILPNVFVFSGIMLLIYAVFGGFTLISAGADSKKADEGKQALTNAIIGFVIIFASYWIIQIIEVITGVPIVRGLN